MISRGSGFKFIRCGISFAVLIVVAVAGFRTDAVMAEQMGMVKYIDILSFVHADLPYPDIKWRGAVDVTVSSPSGTSVGKLVITPVPDLPAGAKTCIYGSTDVDLSPDKIIIASLDKSTTYELNVKLENGNPITPPLCVGNDKVRTLDFVSTGQMAGGGYTGQLATYMSVP
ncbi:hypothetical protein HZX00_002842 [Salmonella enterica]|nr:hypothetical protein [Salmonella enterica]